jgi:hypothetical protein
VAFVLVGYLENSANKATAWAYNDSRTDSHICFDDDIDRFISSVSGYNMLSFLKEKYKKHD